MQRRGPQSWAGAGSRAGAVSRDTARKPGDAQHLLTCEKWGNDGGRDPERGSWAVWPGRCHRSAPAWTPHTLRPWAQEGRAVHGGREPGAAWEPSVGSGWVGVIDWGHSPLSSRHRLCPQLRGRGFQTILSGKNREGNTRPSSVGPRSQTVCRGTRGAAGKPQEPQGILDFPGKHW